MCQSLSIATVTSILSLLGPAPVEIQIPPPTLFFHNMSYVIYSDLIKLIYWARWLCSPPLIPALSVLREVLGEGRT